MMLRRNLILTRKGDRAAIILRLSRFAAQNPHIWKINGRNIQTFRGAK